MEEDTQYQCGKLLKVILIKNSETAEGIRGETTL